MMIEIQGKSDSEVKEILNNYIKEEKEISKSRKEHHKKIDDLKKRLVENLKKINSKIPEEVVLKAILKLANGKNIIPFDDKEIDLKEKALKDQGYSKVDKSIEEKKEHLRKMVFEEAKISFKRRILHGKIDIIKDDIKKRINEHKKAKDGEDEDLKVLVQKISKILSNGF
ncbi:MAG: hypothetical protein KAS39_06405, partial [Actinomycetia bacterium]|nr:hypothetical protein [Actinomycetes bacterium]